MYILFHIQFVKKYPIVIRSSNCQLFYEGYFDKEEEALTYIEAREYGAEYTQREVTPGICVYTIGDTPDYYVLLNTDQIPECPVLIGQLTT